MGSYKCAEDKLESTLGLALAAFQVHPPALITANEGSELTGAAHSHWDWQLLPLKVTFFSENGDLDRLLEQQLTSCRTCCCSSGESQPVCLCL